MEDSQHKATILVVDDSKVMLVAAAKALKGEFEVIRATDGREAWDAIQQHPEISLVFSDLSMPNMNGYELLDTIRGSEDAKTAKLPVVILTGQEDGDGTKEKVIQAGATDFLIKPFEPLDLLSRARSLSRLSSEVNELEKKVSLDKLTRLYTDNSFNDSGERALAYAVRHSTDISIMRVDINDFSSIFVKHGKQIAESVLIKVSEVIKSVLRHEDIAARVAVAKFTMLLIETDREGVIHVAERLRKAIADAVFEISEKVSVSIGCACPQITDSLNLKDIRGDAEEAISRALAEPEKTVIAGESENTVQSAQTEPVKKGPRIDLSAVLREVDNNEGKRLGEKQLNAALNSVLPLLSFLNKKMLLGIDDVIQQLEDRVLK
ncbi:MAG: response regulator [Gammaproteobacteria bacterium]|nr:response regulator [Gammaproteobacteria bacterium]